ncbi:hypothetical protein CR513_29647, partial [Mucuna pruriens]
MNPLNWSHPFLSTSKGQLISVSGERDLMISTLTPIEYIEGDEEALETSFQSLEIAIKGSAHGGKGHDLGRIQAEERTRQAPKGHNKATRVVRKQREKWTRLLHAWCQREV